VTTLVSLAIVLELDPLYFPATSALAVLGLAAAHLRAPVRGLRVLATIYLAVYVILIFLSSVASGARWGVYVYFLAPVLEDHSLVLPVLPGYRTRRGCNAVPACRQAISCNARARAGGSRHRRLALGLELLLVPQHERWFWSRMLVTAARITAPELLLAAIAIYAGRRFGRASAYIPGPGPERDRLAGDAGRFDWADLHLLAEFRGARTCDCQHHTADLRAPGAAAVRGRLVPATGRATIHPVPRHRPVDLCGRRRLPACPRGHPPGLEPRRAHADRPDLAVRILRLFDRHPDLRHPADGPSGTAAPGR